MPTVGAMRNAPDQAAREALWRLAAPRPAAPPAEPLLFLRTPAIALLWAAALGTTLVLLALSRVRVPYVAHGVAVAVRDPGDSLTFLLLLPPGVRAYVRPNQVVSVDTGAAPPAALVVTSVEPGLLDATSARRRFHQPANLLAQLDVPRLAVRVSRCTTAGCLTLTLGTSYPAAAALGTRALSSYVMSRS